MYGLTRGAITLIGVLVAGFLLWLGTQILPDSGEATSGEYWAALGLVAAAGLTMALSQLLGGWTKWGWPRVSAKVFLLAFLPTLILGGWVLAAGDPGDSWFGRHVGSWSEDIGIGGVVADFGTMIPAIAFGIGLVFGFTFDTTGPRVRKATPVATPEPAVTKEHVVAAPTTSRSQRPTLSGTIAACTSGTAARRRRLHRSRNLRRGRGSRRRAESRSLRGGITGRRAVADMRFMDAAPLQTNRGLALILEHCGRLDGIEHTPPTAVLRLRQAAGDELARLLLSRTGRRPSRRSAERGLGVNGPRAAGGLRRRSGCRERSRRPRRARG